MPITDQFHRIKCTDIIVRRDARQRREIKTDDLEPSIRQRGVLQPIIITDELELVAGERRLMASIKLGLPDIPVRFARDLSPIERAIIELEENIKRSDLDWRDACKAVAQVHKLYLALDPEWTMGETADAISLTAGALSINLRVAGELDDDRIASADGLREAYNVLLRRDQRAAGDALQELLDLPTPVEPSATANIIALNGASAPGPQQLLRPSDSPKPGNREAAPAPLRDIECILHQSFLEWAPTYSGPKFNLIHCDFPYGIALLLSGASTQIGDLDYDPSPQVFQELLECFCKNINRFMSVSAHLMFWCSARPGSPIESLIRRTFAQEAPDLDFQQFPLVWHKTDNKGIAANANRMPRHVYETCLLASRGRRHLVRVAADAYGCQTDRRLHASAKPEAMLHHFMQMLVDEQTAILDPTCGSATALLAAERLGAKRVLGLEIDPKTCELARQALRNARLLRQASREVTAK